MSNIQVQHDVDVNTMTYVEMRVLVMTGKTLKANLMELIRQGKSTREASKILQVSQKGIWNYAQKYGLRFPVKQIKVHQRICYGGKKRAMSD